MQPFRFGDGRFGVVGQIGRNFKAHESILSTVFVVDRAQNVGCGLDIGNGQRFVDRLGVVVGRGQLCEVIDVGVAAGDGALEDAGI